MVLADINSGAYKFVLLLHILTVVVAFAPAVVHPLTLERMRGDSALGRVAALAADNGRKVYFPALIAIGVFGVILILLSDEVWEFSDLWVSLAFVVWIAICGIVSGIIMPGERKVAAGDLEASKRVAIGGQIATVLFLVMLYLMIFKPGA